jgi:hypothetical protein
VDSSVNGYDRGNRLSPDILGKLVGREPSLASTIYPHEPQLTPAAKFVNGLHWNRENRRGLFWLQ